MCVYVCNFMSVNVSVTMTDCDQWVSQDIIKTALRKMVSSDLNRQAVQCFRNITGYMGDRVSSKEVCCVSP